MADFTWTPDKVVPSTPSYNIIQTKAESFKKRYYEIDSNEEQFFTLLFGWISKTYLTTVNYRDVLYSHYTTNKGVYNSFSWTVPPTYISAVPVTVRYADYQETPSVDGNVWEVTTVFRVEV